MNLFGCAICGNGGDLYHHVCAACAGAVMEAWHGPATDAEFEAWWKLYPRKVGKDAAREKYMKARKRVSADALTAAVSAYRTEVADKEQQFIAHPTTWLNQGRWQDEGTTNQGDVVECVDLDAKHVRDFVRSGFWLSAWGPRPDENDAPVKIRLLFRSLAPGCTVDHGALEKIA